MTNENSELIQVLTQEISTMIDAKFELMSKNIVVLQIKRCRNLHIISA